MRMKDILSESLISSGEYRYLSNGEIKIVQQHLLKALADIIDLNKKHNFKLFLVGGSLLGAIRHKGFIPWDDDLDIAIKREDYKKFIYEFQKEYEDKYILVAPNYKDDSQVFYCRIYIKGVKKTTPSNSGLDYPKNLFIDLFVIDYAPNNKLIRTLKGIYVDSLRFIGSSVFRYKYKSKQDSRNYSKTFKSRIVYNFRVIIGFIFSFFDYKKWFNLFDKASINRESNYITISSGRKFYLGEVLESKVFDDVEYYDFEHLKVPGPLMYDYYLKNLYGDYMIIPKEEDREKHLAKDVRL